MATQVDFVIERVASLLQDTSHIRWTLTDLVNYINEAQHAITKQVPQSYVKTTDVTLVEGTKQALPADATMLLKVIRNSPGGSPGATIRWVDMDVLNATTPNWHAATADVTVTEYTYEVEDPYVFWVYPPQTATPTDITIRYATNPPVVGPGDNISVGDEYVNAILHYMLHRAYSRESEYAGPEGLATVHYNQFIKELGKA